MKHPLSGLKCRARLSHLIDSPIEFPEATLIDFATMGTSEDGLIHCAVIMLPDGSIKHRESDRVQVQTLAEGHTIAAIGRCDDDGDFNVLLYTEDGFLDLFHHQVQFAPLPPIERPWFPASEPPEPGADVEVWPIRARPVRWTGSRWEMKYGSNRDQDIIEPVTVTHWRPLPEGA